MTASPGLFDNDIVTQWTCPNGGTIAGGGLNTQSTCTFTMPANNVSAEVEFVTVNTWALNVECRAYASNATVAGEIAANPPSNPLAASAIDTCQVFDTTGGGPDVEMTSGFYADGTTVTLTAVPSPTNGPVAAWTACPGTVNNALAQPTCTIVMNSDKSAIVYFSDETATLSLTFVSNPGGSNGGVVTGPVGLGDGILCTPVGSGPPQNCTKVYPVRAVVTLQLALNSGWSVTTFTCPGTVNPPSGSDDGSCTLTMTSGQNVFLGIED